MRIPFLVLIALVCQSIRAEGPLLLLDAMQADAAQRRWTAEVGPSLRLAADTLVLDGTVAFSGRGNPPALTAVRAANPALLPVRAFTAEAVFSVERPGEWGGVIGFLQDNGGEETGWILGYHHGRFTCGLATRGADDGNGRMTYLDGTTRFEPGRLYHLAATYDGAEMRLLVNGRLEGKSTEQRGDILYPASSALILAGYRDANESYPLCGRVAWVRLTPKALDDAALATSHTRWVEACARAPVLTADLPRAPAAAVRRAVGASADNDAVVPTQQHIRPAGRQVVLAGLRPQALAVAPDESYLVATGNSAELLLVDPVAGTVKSRVAMPSGKVVAPPAADHILIPDPKAQVSFTGLAWSPDHRHLVLANVAGDLKVFTRGANGLPVPSHSVPLPPVTTAERKQEIPTGIAFSPDSAHVYVCGNLSNRLLELGVADGALVRAIDVGVAPYDVVVNGSRAYVSNWGGRRPEPGSRVHPAGRGTMARADERGVAAEGSVSVIDLAAGRVVKEILTGRHACALALSPDGRHLAVANANEDTVSVIDTRRDEVVETINLAWQPVGLATASPNALSFTPDGRTLLAANGAQNAVAVIRFRPGESTVSGLVPTGWYPGALALLPKSGTVAVANVKGLGSGAADQLAGKGSSNSHHHTGSLSLFPLPDEAALRAHTRVAMENTAVPCSTPRWRRPAPESRRGRCRSGWASRPPSAMWSTSSRRTAPTTRCWATCPRATATRFSACSARTSPRISTSSAASLCCSTTPTAAACSARTATSGPPRATSPTTWKSPSPGSRAVTPTSAASRTMTRLLTPHPGSCGTPR
jgi:YVTN family beta-propeller protein